MSCTARLCRGWLCTTLVLPVAFWLAACQSPTDTPRNVVLIVIDTVRADHLSVYGYHRPTSPSLQQLASRGALFSRAHATASYTRASTASILTGQYPVVHGAITHSDSMSPQIPTLAEVLKSAGFSTVGIYRNGNVAGTFGFDRGFDSYEVPDKDFLRRAKGDPAIGDVVYVSQTDDSLLTSSAVPFLEGQATGARPFFLYLHLGGAHDPYSPPPTAPTFFEGELTDTARLFYTQPLKPLRDGPTALRQILRGTAEVDDRTREQIVALYDGEIAFADAQVGAILEALEKAGKADETLVIVTADHGEEFWDHGSLGHGESHFQEQLHVPLIVAGPGVRPGTIEEPVSLIDLFPTILDLLRIGGTQEHMPGRSLRSALARPEREFDPRSVYAEGLLRDGRSSIDHYNWVTSS